jgi:hypothetical protein
VPPDRWTLVARAGANLFGRRPLQGENPASDEDLDGKKAKLRHEVHEALQRIGMLRSFGSARLWTSGPKRCAWPVADALHPAIVKYEDVTPKI